MGEEGEEKENRTRKWWREKGTGERRLEVRRNEERKEGQIYVCVLVYFVIFKILIIFHLFEE